MKAFQSGVWTMVGYGASQVIRFGSNLLLTRLLAPEHFGIMAIVNVFLIGLNMFSDIGVGPNIIQSPRSKEIAFLNTAWTVQVARSGILWLVCIVAAFPMSLFYHDPLLMWLIPAAGFSTLISGFNSTNLYTNNRDLNILRPVAIELGSQVLALIVMLLLAWWSPSVWVLIYGSVVGAAFRMVASHYWLPGTHNQFHWEPQAFKELFGFGMWIFFSTLLSFASNSMGSLILGKLVDMKAVGVFTIATTLAKTVEQLYDQISQKVLFPLYSKIKELSHAELLRRIRTVRLVVMAVFLPMAWFLMVFGQDVVNILFDHRYQGAGWILRVFALGVIPPIISGVGPFYLAVGDARMTMVLSAIRLATYIGFLLGGWVLLGANGVIIGMATFTFAMYFAEVFVQNRYKIWLPKLDLLGFASTGIVIASFFLLGGKL